jgi:hypothetical protein
MFILVATTDIFASINIKSDDRLRDIQLFNRRFYIYTTPLCPFPTSRCCSSLDPTTKDGALSLSADLGQPGDVIASIGSLPGESFDSFFVSFPEN